jgi:hypothetical protein
VPRALLLSGTPVLNNKRDFLVMLHLLDPGVNRLDDPEAYRERLSKFQDIGRALLSLLEGGPSYMIKPGIDRLLNLFPRDPKSRLLAEGLDQQAGEHRDGPVLPLLRQELFGGT